MSALIFEAIGSRILETGNVICNDKDRLLRFYINIILTTDPTRAISEPFPSLQSASRHVRTLTTIGGRVRNVRPCPT